MLPILLLMLMTFCVKNASCDYENTWNFYYEQPCCGNEVSNYAKHKRGKLYIFFLKQINREQKNINDYLNLLLKLLCKEKWIVNKLLLQLLEIY